MAGAAIQNLLNPARLSRTADWLAVAVAVSLPWSTSVTGILLVIWLLVLIPTLTWADLRREVTTAAGGLPVLLFLLGALGVLWADVTLLERWKGLDSFFKLLIIPLLLVQFRRSDRGVYVFAGYLWSCIALLVASTVVAAIPPLSAALMRSDHVLVKNPATQSGEFVTCIFGLLFLAMAAFEKRQWWWLFGMMAVILGMLANMFFVATGRTALVVIPVLLVLFAAKTLNKRGIAVVLVGAMVLGAAGWSASPYLRGRTTDVWTEIKNYQKSDEINSSGERLEFWKKSVGFIAEAPLLGHGTGTIHALFKKISTGQYRSSATATTNPHQQTFAVAIQIGLLGAALLWAMWVAHLLLFRGPGLAAWIGLMVVAQNIVGSLFNSHLFDFGQGWTYVLGVGVAGGMALKRSAPTPASDATARLA